MRISSANTTLVSKINSIISHMNLTSICLPCRINVCVHMFCVCTYVLCVCVCASVSLHTKGIHRKQSYWCVCVCVRLYLYIQKVSIESRVIGVCVCVCVRLYPYIQKVSIESRVIGVCKSLISMIEKTPRLANTLKSGKHYSINITSI